MKKSRLLGVVCAYALATIPCMAYATTAIYTNEANFLSAAGATIIESFEPDIVLYQTTPITTSNLVVSTTPILGGTSSFLRIDGGTIGEIYPIDGIRTLIAGSGTEDPFSLTFDLLSPTSSVGFWVTDFGDGGAGDLSFTNNVGDIYTIASSPLENGNALFFGVVNDTSSFTSFSLVKTTTDDGFGVDKIFLSQATVPIPSAVWLFGSGLISLIGFARRKA